MQDYSGYTEAYHLGDRLDNWWTRRGILRPDQLAALNYAYGLPFRYWNDRALEPERDPSPIVSIGCGVGILEETLERLGADVIGVDPAPVVRQLYRGRHLQERYTGGGKTLLFVESLEHIPRDEIERILELAPRGCRIIVTNWWGFFPIPASSSWDHITTVDDALYDRIAQGRRTILREAGHLVVE